MFFVHLRDLSFIWPFREANTRTLFILAEKMVVCCLLLLFVATLSDFGLLFFKLKHSSS